MHIFNFSRLSGVTIQFHPRATFRFVAAIKPVSNDFDTLLHGVIPFRIGTATDKQRCRGVTAAAVEHIAVNFHTVGAISQIPAGETIVQAMQYVVPQHAPLSLTTAWLVVLEVKVVFPAVKEHHIAFDESTSADVPISDNAIYISRQQILPYDPTNTTTQCDICPRRVIANTEKQAALHIEAITSAVCENSARGNIHKTAAAHTHTRGIPHHKPIRQRREIGSILGQAISRSAAVMLPPIKTTRRTVSDTDVFDHHIATAHQAQSLRRVAPTIKNGEQMSSTSQRNWPSRRTPNGDFAAPGIMRWFQQCHVTRLQRADGCRPLRRGWDAHFCRLAPSQRQDH